MHCYYCDLIHAATPGYVPREAEFDMGSEAPRCAWHWRFVCDCCGTPGHWMTRFFCPREGRLLCREAGRCEVVLGEFHAWQYAWTLECPDCGEQHPSLDRAEAAGAHRWQLLPEAEASRRFTFHHASLAAMPFLPDACVDAAVANYVLISVPDYEAAIGEIARVLRPGGRFVCTICHSSTDGAWHLPALDSPRREDRAAWKDDAYFVRRAAWMPCGLPEPVLSFHRPLRDYVAACRRGGLPLRDLEEPEFSEEALRVLPAHVIAHQRRAPASYVLRHEKTG
jgi:SAM-dependent methyltransferase